MQLEPDPLLTEIEQFLTATGISATAFGIQALNDPTLVHEMRKDRECKRATRARIVEFMRNEKARRAEAAD